MVDYIDSEYSTFCFVVFLIPLQQGKDEVPPHYDQVEVGVQVPHLVSFDTLRAGGSSLLLSKDESSSSTWSEWPGNYWTMMTVLVLYKACSDTTPSGEGGGCLTTPG